MVHLDRDFEFEGTVVWLTPEQGGRRSGPPQAVGQDYTATARTPWGGDASFVLRGWTDGAWRSNAQGSWLVADNPEKPEVEVGDVLLVQEGPTTVAYFHVTHVSE